MKVNIVLGGTAWRLLSVADGGMNVLRRGKLQERASGRGGAVAVAAPRLVAGEAAAAVEERKKC